MNYSKICQIHPNVAIGFVMRLWKRPHKIVVKKYFIVVNIFFNERNVMDVGLYRKNSGKFIIVVTYIQCCLFLPLCLFPFPVPCLSLLPLTYAYNWAGYQRLRILQDQIWNILLKFSYNGLGLTIDVLSTKQEGVTLKKREN